MSPDETNEFLLGTGGVPVSAKHRSTEAGIERITELDLAPWRWKRQFYRQI
jgi:hypothetical protein